MAPAPVREVGAWEDGRQITVSVLFEEGESRVMRTFTFTECMGLNKRNAEVKGRRCNDPDCQRFVADVNTISCVTHCKHNHQPDEIAAALCAQTEAATAQAKINEERQKALGSIGAEKADEWRGEALAAGAERLNAAEEHPLGMLPPLPPSTAMLRERESDDGAIRMPPTRAVSSEAMITQLQAQLNGQLALVTQAAPSPIVLCKGLKLAIPEPLANNYPFQLHSPESPFPLEWTWPDPDGTVRSTAPRCKWIVTAAGQESCEPCMFLHSNTKLQNIVARAATQDAHLKRHKNVLLTYAQLSNRISHKDERESANKLSLMQNNSKLRSMMKLPTQNERLLSAIAAGSMPRLHILIRRLRKKGTSQYQITRQIEMVARGERKILGDWEEEEFKAAYLHVAFGGQRGLKLARVREGSMSKETLRRQDMFAVPRFFGDSGEMEARVMVGNVDQMLATSPAPSSRALHTGVMDNMGLDERLRYSFDREFGGCKGVARESTFTGSLVIRNFQDADEIRKGLQGTSDLGRILLSKENTHLAVIRNAKDSAIIPIYSSGTAKVKGHNTAQDQQWILQTFEKIWKGKCEKTHGPLVAMCLDNDSTNSTTLKNLYESHEMPGGPLRDLVLKLPLMDTCSNANGVVSSNDDQHNGKNARAILAAIHGFATNTIKMDREELIAVLNIFTGLSLADLATFFPPANVDDHQNVDKMVKGMMAIAKLKGKTIADIQGPYSDRRKRQLAALCSELQVLAILAECWVFLFTNKSASLSAHLRNLSKMAHVAFVMMRHKLPKKTSAAMTWQTYKGLQRSVRAHFIAVLRGQLEELDEFYLFLNATHYLEVLFGIKRTLVGAQRGLDALQDEERTSTVVVIRSILQEHPDWGLGMRRLQTSFDHWNTRSWEGDVKLDRVTPPTDWVTGRSECVNDLSNYCPFYSASEYDFEAIRRDEPDTTLLYPRGRNGAYEDVIGDDPAVETEEEKPTVEAAEVKPASEAAEAKPPVEVDDDTAMARGDGDGEAEAKAPPSTGREDAELLADGDVTGDDVDMAAREEEAPPAHGARLLLRLHLSTDRNCHATNRCFDRLYR